VLKVVKVAPSLITLALAGWVVWPLLSGGSDASPLAETFKRATELRSPLARRSAAAPQDPFQQLIAELGAQRNAGAKTQPDEQETERLGPVELAARMTLSATIIRGRKRIAMIDGKFYEPGDRLRGDDDAPLPLVLRDVEPHRVVLESGQKRIELSYATNTAAAAVPGPPPQPKGKTP
jgi:hypothetical protein